MAKKEYNIILILIFIVFCFLMYREYKRKQFECNCPEEKQEPIMTAEIVENTQTEQKQINPIETTEQIVYTGFLPMVNNCVEVSKTEIENLLKNDDSILFLYEDEKYFYYSVGGAIDSQCYKVIKF